MLLSLPLLPLLLVPDQFLDLLDPPVVKVLVIMRLLVVKQLPKDKDLVV